MMQTPPTRRSNDERHCDEMVTLAQHPSFDLYQGYSERARGSNWLRRWGWCAGFRPPTYGSWPRRYRTVGSRFSVGALVLQVEAGEPVPIKEHDLALAIAGEPEDTQTVQPR
jgi:hypothetical protein